eukprot:9383906-Alexandrium_andersonii.AAC.1
MGVGRGCGVAVTRGCRGPADVQCSECEPHVSRIGPVWHGLQDPLRMRLLCPPRRTARMRPYSSTCAATWQSFAATRSRPSRRAWATWQHRSWRTA